MLLETSVFKFFDFYLLTFNYMQLKIVVLSVGGKKWCFDRLESDMMIFCEWLMEGVREVHEESPIASRYSIGGYL